MWSDISIPLSKNFPQCFVIHIVKGSNVVNKAEVDGSLELSCFFDDPVDVSNLISGSSAFSKTHKNPSFLGTLQQQFSNFSLCKNPLNHGFYL